MSLLSGKTVLVTGAAGFIGSNLVRGLLAEGSLVHALVRPSGDLWRLEEVLPRLELHPVDLTEREELARAVRAIAPQIIFHLAANGVVRRESPWTELLRTNVFGTQNLLEALSPLDWERFVHLGGSTEYARSDRPLAESDRPEPLTALGASKAAATLLVRQFSRERRRAIVILRPFSVYGCWESPSRLVPTAIRAALEGREMALTSGVFRRDLVFVEDVVEACLAVTRCEVSEGEILNVGTGREWTNEEVVAMVESVTGHRIRTRPGQHPPRENDRAHWVADTEKAARLLGWRARHTLTDGLRKAVAWWSRVGEEVGVS